MRKINKNTKIYLIHLATLILATSSWIAITKEMNIEMSKLEREVEILEIEQERLLKLKTLYEEVIATHEENEDNLNKQVETLEFNIMELEEENENLRIIRAKLTAYSPLDNVDGQQAEGNPNRTSIGKRVSRGIVAADPKKLPYGTKLEIPTWGVVEVGDTGGALRSDNKNIRIDVFKNTYPEAMKFGVKDMDIKILEWGGN